MTTHRVLRGEIVRSSSQDDGKQVIEAGETFEATDAELQAFDDNIVEVGKGADSSESSENDSTNDSAWVTDDEDTEEAEEPESQTEASDDLPEFQSMNVPDAEETLSELDYDEQKVDALHAKEREGDDRIMVHEAIDENL